MAQVQDSFTQRLLQRASQRRSKIAQQTDEQILQRRNNILKAINVPSVAKEIPCDANNNESSCDLEPRSLEALPVMESTRKLAHSNSTRILHSSEVTSSISTIDASNLEVTFDDSVKVVAQTATYDATNFLVDALGDELNNTSVTYDESAWQKSRSDFDASDLMSRKDFSQDESVLDDVPMPLKGLQPRSSSTLNRSMKIDRSVWEEMVRATPQRVSRLRAFLRLLRRLLQGMKNVLCLKVTSKR